MDTLRITTALWLTVTCLWIGVGAQDLSALKYKLEEHRAREQLFSDDESSQHLKAAKQSLHNLNAFWTPDADTVKRFKLGNEWGNITAACINGTARLMDSTDPTTGLPMIVRMIDAMGKLGAGFLDGNSYLDGAYDECLDIGPGEAEYCLGDITPTKIKSAYPLTLHVGMCVPRGCTPEDVVYAIDTGTFGVMTADPATVSCVSTRKPPYNAGAIIMIIVCFIFVFLVLAATVFDFILQLLQTDAVEYESGQIQDDTNLSEKAPLVPKPQVANSKSVKPTDFILAFSLYKVLSQILATKQPPSAITSINGLRVMSMFWVIVCHTHFWSFTAGVNNVYRLKNFLSRFTFQAIGNAFFSVDSFFFLSGLLVAYLSMRQMKQRKGRFPFVAYYLHRYLRLTPTYAFVLFFVWFLTMHLGDGPKYHLSAGEDSTLYKTCSSYWWTNLFYINNLYPWKLEDECVGWTWYLANDMQFYIFSPLILIPLYFLFPFGLAISGIVLFVSFFVSGTLAGFYDLQANEFAAFAYGYVSNNTSPYTSYQSLLYIKPWHRVTPYIVGLLLGYILYRFRLPKKPYVNYIVFPILWVASGVFLITTLYGLYFQWHGHTPDKAENIIYIMFSRFVWSLGLALLVFICHYGYGGIVNRFLSMSFWIPLSRISYNAYLVHPLVLTVIFGSERNSINYQDYNIAVYSVGIVVLSYGAAAVVSVFVEFPIGNLEQALFKLVGLKRHESARTGGEGDQDHSTSVRVDSPLHSRPFIGNNNNSNSA